MFIIPESHANDAHSAECHHSKLHMQGGNVCLADWCEVLHCDYFAGKPETHHFFHHHTAPCRPKAKMKLKQQCQARHLHMFWCCSNFLVRTYSWLSEVTCAHAQDLAQRCFPPDVSKEGTLMYGKQGNTVAIIIRMLQGIQLHACFGYQPQAARLHCKHLQMHGETATISVARPEPHQPDTAGADHQIALVTSPCCLLLQITSQSTSVVRIHVYRKTARHGCRQ